MTKNLSFLEKLFPDMKYYCEGGCGKKVARYGARCPSCQARFESICDSYRAMYRSAKNDADLKDKINRFRSGDLTP